MSIVPYNPNDPTQQSFLQRIRSGESTGPNAYFQGYGNVDLSGAPTNSTGFPIWSGNAAANTHAAGGYQFQPGTWNPIATKYNLNFQNPADQDAAAWYDAQTVYQNKTGGDLTTSLATNPSGVGSALHSEWTSVNQNSFTGLQTTPQDPNTQVATNTPPPSQTTGSGTGTNSTSSTGSQSAINAEATGYAALDTAGSEASGGQTEVVGILPGFAKAIGTYLTGAEGTATQIASGAGVEANALTLGSVSSGLSTLANWTLRGFLIFVGVVILAVALWKLLSDQGVVASPSATFKATSRVGSRFV